MELNLSAISGKVFQFNWNDPMHSTLVEVKIPNLSQLRHTAWGDWGPMYRFTLKESNPIQISYNGKNLESKQGELRIESPMLAQLRKKLPYYIVVEDKANQLDFHLYVNHNYELGKIEVIKNEQESRIMLFESSDESILQVAM